MADEKRINGNLYSWSSIYFKVDGEVIYGITAISYGDSLERVKGYGMGRHHAPRGRSAGKYATDPVQVTVEKETARVLRDTLAKKSSSGRSFGKPTFQIVVQYVENDGTSITDEVEDCTWTKNAAKHEEGPDPLKEDLEFDCMKIRWNGKYLFDDSEGSP